MRVSQIARLVSVFASLLCLLAFASVSFAQGDSVPVQIGQNVTGTLAQGGSARYTLTAQGGETAAIQVLSLTSGAAPSFRVLNTAGVEILNVPNPNNAPTLAGNVNLNDAGVYMIELSGGAGQFVLSLQPGVPLPQALPLAADQPVTATVGSGTPALVYRFTTAPGAAALNVISQSSAPLVTLYDESLGRTVASSSAGLLGITYQLPADGRSYRIEVRAADGDSTFTICAGNCGSASQQGNVSAPPTSVPNTVPTQPSASTGICTASPSTGGAANLRSGPGTQYAILGGLPLGQSFPVTGMWTGGSWYQVDAGGVKLWVSSSVVSFNGDCAALPLLEAPANAPLAPTQIPTATPTPPATATLAPTATPTATEIPNLPDLALQGMTIVQDSPTHARVAFDVYNKGTVDVTQPFYVYVCITVLCVEKQITLPVRAGSATYVFVDFNHPSSTVLETVAVAVDSRGEIAEINESNNTTSLADVSLNF